MLSGGQAVSFVRKALGSSVWGRDLREELCEDRGLSVMTSPENLPSVLLCVEEAV